jgi:anti-sigma-K factor RskA
MMSSRHVIESTPDCDAIQDLIPEYAFGLTSPEESRLVESSLTSCPDAAAELANFRHMQEEMRAGVPQIEPPPQLAERLLAATAAPTAASVSLRRPPFHLAWLAAAAAVLALIITNAYWFARVEDVSRQTAELRAMIGGAQTGDAFVLTSTNDLRWVRLPSEANAETTAFLMWNGESETGLLYVHGFPRLEPGKTYQLWLTRGEERVSAGTFEVDELGNAALIFHTADPIDRFTWARVTDEPEYGSEQPTGAVVVHGELPTG